jgi:hypothetical protein
VDIREEKMKPFTQMQNLQPTWIDKIIKQTPRKNFIIDVNNLLATKDLDSLENSEIEALGKVYEIKNPNEKFRKEFIEFLSSYITANLGIGTIDSFDFQSVQKMQQFLDIPKNDFENVYVPIAEDFYRNRAKDIIVSHQNFDEEVQSLVGKIQEQLNLSTDKTDEMCAEIRKDIVQNYFNEIVADRRLSPEEVEKYIELCKKMHVNASFDENTANLVEKYKNLWKIENDVLPEITTDIYLQKNEKCHFMENATLYESRKVTKRVNYGGPTFRVKIAKGIYYRAGSVGVSRESEDVLTQIDTGTLYITNKRILFTGTKNNKTIKYSQIIDLNPYNDGVEIIKDSGRNPTFQLETNEGDVLITILARILRDEY